jgi:hypothetical protein
MENNEEKTGVAPKTKGTTRPFLAGGFTVFWMIALAAWALCLHFKWRVISYTDFNKWEIRLAIPYTLAALGCLWGYHKKDIFQDSDTTSLGSWSIAGIVFWVLFPPVWFFLVFHGVVSGAIAWATESDRANLKSYADLASKIWAAFLALYGVIITYRIKEQEELTKKRKEQAAIKVAVAPGDDI